MSGIDWTAMKGIVTDVVNTVIPIFMLPLGIALAIGLLTLVMAAFGKIFRG